MRSWTSRGSHKWKASYDCMWRAPGSAHRRALHAILSCLQPLGKRSAPAASSTASLFHRPGKFHRSSDLKVTALLSTVELQGLSENLRGRSRNESPSQKLSHEWCVGGCGEGGESCASILSVLCGQFSDEHFGSAKMAETIDVEHNKEPIHVVLGKPHQFADVGKQAKDLLYKGFSNGHMLMMSCLMPGGAFLSSTATMLDGAIVGNISTSFKSGGVQTELSGGTLNQISASSTYEELAPGLKIALQTVLPGAENIGKAQVQYQLNNAAFDATMIGLKSTPTLQLSANLGSERLSLGGSALYNSETKEVSALSTGIGYLRPDMSASFFYDPFKDNAMDAYFTRQISPRATFGGHLHFEIEKQLTSATFGGSLKIDPQTTIKAKWDNQGVVGTLFEHQPNQYVTLGMYLAVDTTNLKKQPNVGFSFSVLGTVA